MTRIKKAKTGFDPTFRTRPLYAFSCKRQKPIRQGKRRIRREGKGQITGLAGHPRGIAATVQRDGPMRAGRNAGMATVTQAGIDEGRLTGIQAQNGFGATDLARRTDATCPAQFVHDDRDCWTPGLWLTR